MLEELCRQFEDGVVSFYVWYDNYVFYQVVGGVIVVCFNSGIKVFIYFFNVVMVCGQGVGKVFLLWFVVDMVNLNCWLVLEIDVVGEVGIVEDERLMCEYCQVLYWEVGVCEIIGVFCYLFLDNVKGMVEKVLMLFVFDIVQYLLEGKVIVMVLQLFYVVYGKEFSYFDFFVVLWIFVGYYMLVQQLVLGYKKARIERAFCYRECCFWSLYIYRMGMM